MIILNWVHLAAAVAWIGGMLFLSLVLVPVFKRVGFSGERRILFQALAKRFRVVVWTSIVLLLLTGPLLLATKGESSSGETAWPAVLTVKLSLVVILLGLTAVHDLWLGPRMIRAQGSSPVDAGAQTSTLARLSPWIARLALVLGVIILALGVAVAKSEPSAFGKPLVPWNNQQGRQSHADSSTKAGR